jgi:hypothetical protein
VVAGDGEGAAAGEGEGFGEARGGGGEFAFEAEVERVAGEEDVVDGFAAEKFVQAVELLEGVGVLGAAAEIEVEDFGDAEGDEALGVEHLGVRKAPGGKGRWTSLKWRMRRLMGRGRGVADEVAVVAGGGDGASAGGLDDAVEVAGIVGQEHADAPGLAVGVEAFGKGFAADFDEEMFESALAQEGGDVVHAEALGDGAEVELEFGDGLGEPAVGGEGEVAPAGGRARGGDLLGRGGGAADAVGSEAPEVDEGADGGIEGAAGGGGEVEGAADDELEVGGEDDGLVGAGAVELGDFAVGEPGGHLAVEFGEGGVDVGLQLGEVAAGERRAGDADGVGGAHGAAVQGGVAGRRSATGQEKQEESRKSM